MCVSNAELGSVFTKSHQLGDPKNLGFSQRYMLCQHVGRLIVLLPFLRCWRALLTYKAFPSLVWGPSTLTEKGCYKDPVEYTPQN